MSTTDYEAEQSHLFFVPELRSGNMDIRNSSLPLRSMGYPVIEYIEAEYFSDCDPDASLKRLSLVVQYLWTIPIL